MYVACIDLQLRSAIVRQEYRFNYGSYIIDPSEIDFIRDHFITDP